MDPELEEMQRELARLREENAELRRRLGMSVAEPTLSYSEKSEESSLGGASVSLLTADSSTREKILLFRNLFRGREDVFAVFWTNERSGKKGYSPAAKDRGTQERAKQKSISL
jgi:hypothetical protein